ncbi:hypothetical protein GGR42_003277 [Saonia flava]|uniref:Prenyltransferase n=1 Tax=Saonia flava TaxID=523696 RepID=A0A846QV22_9FLAO|nr:hypothetical protein [Saonia flava]NJB72786.1 hypothetical protein [Saonia flava]
MKWPKILFDFYLDASIHVAFSVLALFHITHYFLELPLHIHLSFFVFFSTIACYNFIKYGVEAEKYILVANRYHKNIQFASFIAVLLALYHAYFLPIEIWKVLGIMAILTGLYALPVFPKAKNLRSLGVLKVFLVALVWAGTTVILPVVAAQKTALNWDVWIETIQRFVLVLILLLPFEIRDLQYDSPNLKTLPQRFGVAKTKILGSFATVLFFALTFFIDSLSILETIAKGILFLTLGIMMYTTKRIQKKYFASFWLEAVPIFWWGIIWGLNNWI